MRCVNTKKSTGFATANITNYKIGAIKRHSIHAEYKSNVTTYDAVEYLINRLGITTKEFCDAVTAIGLKLSVSTKITYADIYSWRGRNKKRKDGTPYVQMITPKANKIYAMSIATGLPIEYFEGNTDFESVLRLFGKEVLKSNMGIKKVQKKSTKK